ncbi:hypothetical protein Q9292_09990 [Methylophilus sp. VKM B-3414]|uniref:hypothetical protein n=1 Tax=Methylophilus sp. VKM B-3414 TaxID=3076121 RepID=UPI0028CA70E2|nr:hypothetical protein [Methylophilus sp. VKM B-3414]MDT7849941.1 hypothetical protein [Methylophilus sp. VKM B-3414]
MHSKHIGLNGAIFSTFCYPYTDTLDQGRVAAYGLMTVNAHGVRSTLEFNLGKEQALEMIKSLEQHLENIHQAEKSLSQEATHV